MVVDALVIEKVGMVDTLASEDMWMDTLALEGVGLEAEGIFMDGTEAPPQVIQLVIRIGKFIRGGSFCFSFSDRYQINPSLGITFPNMPSRRELNLTAISC